MLVSRTGKEALLDCEQDGWPTQLAPAVAQKSKLRDTDVHQQIHVGGEVKLPRVRALMEEEGEPDLIKSANESARYAALHCEFARP